MKLNKSTAVMDYKLVTAFESVRKRLLRPKFADRLDKPLAYWAIATDRRLPLAFMGRSLRELLDTPFDELFSTAGIGQKKIRTFLMLLNRAAQPKPLGALAADEEGIPDAAASAAKEHADVIDPSIVSEALWVRWRASVRNHGFDKEPLGRFAATLLDMPRVIWHRPLGSYTELTLAEIRSLRTHGEKRVSAVLDVFGNLHRILVNLDTESRLAVQIAPRFLIPIETWVLCWLTNVGVPNKQEIREALVSPLIEQIKIDAGPLIGRLAEGRLESQSGSVRKAAHKLGLTRARIYQLLSEVAEVVNLRWPAGPALVGQLRNKMQSAGVEPELLAWLDAAIELFFVRARSEEGRDEDGQAPAPHDEPARGAHASVQERNGHGSGSKTGPRRRSG
ncbi:MAG TPA: hypothetical protein VG125_16830 [Pirellulales bacterium]|jgi:hypothetical protein|nr:hypothetical protein [Pirellulales bacterium]